MGSAAAGEVSKPPWWRIRLYPFAIPVSVVLVSWVELGIHPSEMLRAAIIGVILVAAVGIALNAVVRDPDRAALITIFALAAFAESFGSPAQLAMVAAVVVVLLHKAVTRGRPLPMAPLVARLMSLFALILILAPTLAAIQAGTMAAAIGDIARDRAPSGAVTAPTGSEPDVMLVLLDGFPGDDAAGRAQAFGVTYDESRLPDALSELGFEVQRNSRSNYMYTPDTLASMFQMQHLVDIRELKTSTDSHDGHLLYRLMNDGRAVDAFHGRGYELISIAPNFAAVRLRRVDEMVEVPWPTEYEVALLRSTSGGDILATLLPDVLPELQRRHIYSTFDAFERKATEPHDRPRFILAHLPAPHAPWVFGPNGEPRWDGLGSFYDDTTEGRTTPRLENAQAAFDQASFVGDLTAATVQRVLDGLKRPAIIIVFSDHGTGVGFSYDRPLDSDLNERSSNIFASYAPDLPQLFSDPVTPIEVFPSILNRLFDMGVSVPSDALYSRTTSPREFVEIDRFTWKPK